MMIDDTGITEAAVTFCHPYSWSRVKRRRFIAALPITGPLWLLGAAFVYYLALCAAIGLFFWTLPDELKRMWNDT